MAIQARKVVANCYEVVSVARTPWLSQIPHPTLAARSNRCTLCRFFRRNRPASDWKGQIEAAVWLKKPPCGRKSYAFGTAWRRGFQAIRRNADRENRAASRRNLRSDRSCRRFQAPRRRPSPEPVDTEPAHCLTPFNTVPPAVKQCVTQSGLPYFSSAVPPSPPPT